MSNQTLFLVQSSFKNTDYIFDQLQQIASKNDHIILMGDAVHLVNDERILLRQHIFILENDAEILINDLPSHIQIISYDQFADLILIFNRCVRLK